MVPQESLEKWKKKSKYRLAKKYETNNGHVDAIETKIYRKLTPEQIFENINAVTAEDIRTAAIKYLPESRDVGNYVLAATISCHWDDN